MLLDIGMNRNYVILQSIREAKYLLRPESNFRYQFVCRNECRYAIEYVIIGFQSS